MLQINPMQFNIQKLWLQSSRELLEVESIQEALANLESKWLEIAKFKYEENAGHDEAVARENLDLDVHVGKVKVKDFHWLCATFENIDLVELSLAIAAHVMPEKEWEIIEDDEEAVVTDFERSVVFDLKFGSEMSAGASLLQAGDKKYQPTEAVSIEFNAWLEKSNDLHHRRIQKMQKDLEQFSQPGAVIQFPSKS